MLVLVLVLVLVLLLVLLLLLLLLPAAARCCPLLLSAAKTEHAGHMEHNRVVQ